VRPSTIARVLGAVVFDLYDTLIDYDDAQSRQFTEAAAELLGREPEEFHRTWRDGRPIRDTGPLSSYLAELGIDGDDARRLLDLRRSWSRDLLSHAREGAVETLTELRARGLRTA
jgi:FMN phosphatase YigB (HAD superfamily)